MGFADAFAYRSAADVFREHAALSAFENDGTRDFDIGGLAAISRCRLRRARAGAMAAAAPGRHAAERRFFADGGFFTADRKARFIAPEPPALEGGDVVRAFRCVSTPAASATSGTP